MLFRGLGPGYPWKRSPGTIRTHTDPYGSIRIHPDTSQTNFQYFVGHILDMFGKYCQTNAHVKRNMFLMEIKVVPLSSLCRMHRLSNYGGLFVDEFVDISNFMIWVRRRRRTPGFPHPPTPMRPGQKHVVRLGSSLR